MIQILKQDNVQISLWQRLMLGQRRIYWNRPCDHAFLPCKIGWWVFDFFVKWPPCHSYHVVGSGQHDTAWLPIVWMACTSGQCVSHTPSQWHWLLQGSEATYQIHSYKCTPHHCNLNIQSNLSQACSQGMRSNLICIEPSTCFTYRWIVLENIPGG